MSRLRNQIDATRAQVRSLWGVVVLLTALLAMALFGWHRALEQITLHYPPDLRAGAVLGINEVPPPNMYAFA